MTFAEQQADHDEVRKIGDALADTSYNRGERLTLTERQALTHWSRWGSTGYPIRKIGSKWTIEHTLAGSGPLYPTKRAAVRAWEILIAKWIRMSGLESRDAARKIHAEATP